jgi:hypothetical protein
VSPHDNNDYTLVRIRETQCRHRRLALRGVWDIVFNRRRKEHAEVVHQSKIGSLLLIMLHFRLSLAYDISNCQSIYQVFLDDFI